MISIIDYGLGNIAAFVSAYQLLGIGCEIVSNPEDLKKTTHIANAPNCPPKNCNPLLQFPAYA